VTEVLRLVNLAPGMGSILPQHTRWMQSLCILSKLSWLLGTRAQLGC